MSKSDVLDDKIKQRLSEFIDAHAIAHPKFNEIVQHYVYALRDSEKGTIFYVGQGIGSRIMSHFDGALGDGDGSKLETIRDIFGRAEEPELHIVRRGLTKDQALMIEGALIDLIDPIGNKVRGHGANTSGMMLYRDLVKEVRAEPVAPTKAYAKVFLFPIRKALVRDKNAYLATKDAWTKHALMEGNDAIAVGLVAGYSEAVFKVDRWHPSDRYPSGWGFTGVEDKQSELQGKRWNAVLKGLGYWQQGNYIVVEFDGGGKFKVLRGSKNRDWRPLVEEQITSEMATPV